jgi:hypothetical protein
MAPGFTLADLGSRFPSRCDNADHLEYCLVDESAIALGCASTSFSSRARGRESRPVFGARGFSFEGSDPTIGKTSEAERPGFWLESSKVQPPGGSGIRCPGWASVGDTLVPPVALRPKPWVLKRGSDENKSSLKTGDLRSSNKIDCRACRWSRSAGAEPFRSPKVAVDESRNLGSIRFTPPATRGDLKRSDEANRTKPRLTLFYVGQGSSV